VGVGEREERGKGTMIDTNALSSTLSAGSIQPWSNATRSSPAGLGPDGT
jgi:hypothetical protein